MISADDLRERALQCIRLAGATTDEFIKPKLLALAGEMIAKADDIDAQIARVLRAIQDEEPKG